ncbi:MAG TPA: cation-translocating P-type ATPase [Clostridiaceae bacterium]|nr:cation-translocating P-type ATPase [Clostridiaceae bacterium]
MKETSNTNDSFLAGEHYQLSRETIIERLETDPVTGLDSTEAERRQAIYGANQLEAEQAVPLWKKILEQFKDVMIIVLIIAAIISGVLGELIDSILIIAIVLINAILGVYQEGKAEKAIEALQKMAAPEARVLRNGEQTMIKASDIVPGDIVVLEAGDIVPADIRLLESSNLQAEEASLTGESVPVDKNAEFIGDGELGIGDRSNMIFSSTALTYGHGRGIVLEIAEKTEVGKIAKRLKGIEQEATPLQKSLNDLGKVLAIICLAVCAIVFVVGLFQGGDLLELFMTAVSLAVAAIPEGLPAIVTIVLALGMNRMAKKNAIVKRLLAVETLGSVDTICSDKTGTLTQNEMTVTRLYVADKLYEVSGTGYEPQGEITEFSSDQVVQQSTPELTRLLEIAALCNEASLIQKDDQSWAVLGDPTEGALLTLSAKLNFIPEVLKEKYPRLGDLPFDSSRKMMSVFHEIGGEYVSLTKGAPDIVLDRCTQIMTENGIVELSDLAKTKVLEANSAFANSALRVLSFAYKLHPDQDFLNAEQDMIFVGLSGMIDPARPEAKDAIAVCHGAGIRAVMITGDYKDTAVAIAKNLNLMQEGDQVLTGTELEKMSDKELEEVCDKVAVYARVSPEHKVRIVAALKAKAHIAAMTGDGVNDAPALKQSDIGVAMGITGTEVAKSSADMILTDDNFATIVTAVEEGRIIYSNIRKFVSFLLSCNVGEILVVFITNLLLGPQFTPLVPIQLLWLNLVTDSFPALALGREKGEKDIMLHPPRKSDESIINREMIASITTQAVAIFIAVFSAFQIGRFLYPDIMLTDPTIQAASYSFMATTGFGPSLGARTYAFITLIFAELLRAFSSRSEHYSVFQLGFFSNSTMNKSVLISTILMLIVVYIPLFQTYFHTIALSGRDWLIIACLAIIPFVIGEIFKLIYHKDTRAKADRIRQKS